MSKLGGETVVLQVPKRLSVRFDVQAGLADSGGRLQMLQRVVAAALALCWPTFTAKKDTPRYTGDLLEYGAQVIDFLGARGVTIEEIWTHGGPALKLCTDGLVTTEQIQAAQGNSEAPAATGSGPSSGSSDGGGNSPDGSALSIPMTLPS